jgi:hypothetical protein
VVLMCLHAGLQRLMVVNLTVYLPSPRHSITPPRTKKKKNIFQFNVT